MEKILVITELFYPSNEIGAVRPTKLTKFLQRKGYYVTVFTAAHCLNQGSAVELPHRVIYAGDSHSEASSQMRFRVNGLHKSKIMSSKLIKELKITKRQIILYKKGKLFADLFEKYVDNGNILLDEYDCVFSTFGPIGSLLAGLKAKEKKPSLIWINDFRDPMVSQIMPKIVKPYYSYIQRKSIRLADFTTTVSNGYAKRMSFGEMPHSIIVIPNGYDREDLVRKDVNEPDATFSFAYVGALYEGKRDIRIVFKQLLKLIEEKVIKQDDIRFHYAGGEGEYLIAQASKYNMENVIVDHGYVSREESLRIQTKARFLVLSTWNDKGEEGVFPGKLLEYMLMKKPIVSVVGGSLPHSEVTEVVRKFGLGVSYEMADPSTEGQLYDWVKKQAEQFNMGKQPEFNPDQEAISKQYDWENIVERFCELIDGKKEFLRS